jgi:hypothetical protein
MNIILIETSGNQHYIFATNKLRENVGASELTYRAGTEVVRQVISSEVEEIIATSGKAVLLVKSKDRKIAEAVISEVTKEALEKMPGLTIHGAICEVQDDLSNIHEAIKKVHHRLEDIRYKIPSNDQRFLRLPFVAPCDTSGLPAGKVKQCEAEAKRYSHTASIKSEYRNKGYQRIRNQFPSIDFIKPEDIEKRNWVAVIHADGNGVGEIFLNFADRINYESGEEKGQTYRKKYRRFSDALDDCTIKATQTALESFKKKYLEEIKEKLKELEDKGKNEEAEELKKIPIIPLVLGGDDLTILCDGQYALKFTHDFLTEFENQTSRSDIIKEVAQNAFGTPRLGICAGVAIIKPHYPFHQAYELAEQLLKSAKKVKENIKHLRKTEKGTGEAIQLPCSALDFHILYDSAHSELSEIRDEKLKVADKTSLCAKPYVVTETLDGQDNNDWLKYRRFEELRKRVEAMTEPANDDVTRRALPSSKLHEIRQSLFRGKDVADAEATLVKNRLSLHKKKSEDRSAKEIFEKEILIEEKTLFFTDLGKSFTHFLDAIEAVDFWKGFGSEETTQSAGSNSEAEPGAETEVAQ